MQLRLEKLVMTIATGSGFGGGAMREIVLILEHWKRH